MLQTAVSQKRDGALVEIGSLFLAGHGLRVIAKAARQQLATEARVFIDFQHVNAGVIHTGCHQRFERLLPTGGGLVGHAGD